MSTLAHKKLNSTSLKINDPVLKKAFEDKTYPEINQVSKYMVLARCVYSTIILAQMFFEEIDFKRPTVFITFTIMHYVFIHFCELMPSL